MAVFGDSREKPWAIGRHGSADNSGNSCNIHARMRTAKVMVCNQLGLHARAAAKLVQLASGFDCSVAVARDGREVNAKSIMGVMMLAASCGSELTFRTEGTDEVEALDAIRKLVEDGFGENQ